MSLWHKFEKLTLSGYFLFYWPEEYSRKKKTEKKALKGLFHKDLHTKKLPRHMEINSSQTGQHRPFAKLKLILSTKTATEVHTNPWHFKVRNPFLLGIVGILLEDSKCLGCNQALMVSLTLPWLLKNPVPSVWDTPHFLFVSFLFLQYAFLFLVLRSWPSHPLPPQSVVTVAESRWVKPLLKTKKGGRRVPREKAMILKTTFHCSTSGTQSFFLSLLWKENTGYQAYEYWPSYLLNFHGKGERRKDCSSQ